MRSPHNYRVFTEYLYETTKSTELQYIYIRLCRLNYSCIYVGPCTLCIDSTVCRSIPVHKVSFFFHKLSVKFRFQSILKIPDEKVNSIKFIALSALRYYVKLVWLKMSLVKANARLHFGIGGI